MGRTTMARPGAIMLVLTDGLSAYSRMTSG